MCGLAGLIHKDGTRPASPELIRVMIDTIAHRGPDDEGMLVDGCVGLGHRRLSIIDLTAAGRQPMWSHDGRHAIVYNGEIYNYLELRRELEARGRTFRTHTDTEVILAAYDAWGESCVERFNGMWALAIWDAQERRFFFSRDRFGIKPLYYLDGADSLAFASEIKAILAAFPEERRVNAAMVHHFLPAGAQVDGPETFFENIRSFPPAHNGTYDIARGRLRLRRYWDLEPQRLRGHWQGGDPVVVLRELLESAIELHQRSDVPVGTCLSGGVDSSTIVCIMSARRHDPVHTYSGLYDDPDCNEEEYVEHVNQHARTIPGLVRPAPGEDFIEELAHLTWHQDMPTAGPGLYTQYQVMRRASQDVKVILDGQGGDEVFAGYLPCIGPALQDLAAHGPRGRLRAAALLVPILRHWGARLAATMLPHACGSRAAARARRLRDRVRASRPGSRPALFHPALLERVGAEAIARAWPQRFPGQLDQTLYAQVIGQSLPALLQYEDGNSMAFSIEARVPLLDHRIVEFAFALEGTHKVHGSWTKWILRKAAEPYLPGAVAWRRSKLGYPTPFSRWLRTEPMRGLLEDMLFSAQTRAREIVNAQAVRLLWDAHQERRADNGWLIWRLVTLELWHRGLKHFATARVPSAPRV